MQKNEIFDIIEDTADVELVGRGQFESAGQVYYEISVAVHRDLDEFAETLRETFEECHDSDWVVSTYPDWTGPTGWDNEADEEIETNMTIKKNLYNEHMI